MGGGPPVDIGGSWMPPFTPFDCANRLWSCSWSSGLEDDKLLPDWLLLLALPDSEFIDGFAGRMWANGSDLGNEPTDAPFNTEVGAAATGCVEVGCRIGWAGLLLDVVLVGCPLLIFGGIPMMLSMLTSLENASSRLVAELVTGIGGLWLVADEVSKPLLEKLELMAML